MKFRVKRWTGPYPGCQITEPHRAAECKTCKAARMRAYRQAGRWLWMYTDKAKARCYLNVALKRGKVARLPCAVCGEAKVQAHHKDYSKPLDVQWLCGFHHRELHSQAKMPASGEPAGVKGA